MQRPGGTNWNLGKGTPVVGRSTSRAVAAAPSLARSRAGRAALASDARSLACWKQTSPRAHCQSCRSGRLVFAPALHNFTVPGGGGSGGQQTSRHSKASLDDSGVFWRWLRAWAARPSYRRVFAAPEIGIGLTLPRDHRASLQAHSFVETGLALSGAEPCWSPR